MELETIDCLSNGTPVRFQQVTEEVKGTCTGCEAPGANVSCGIFRACGGSVWKRLLSSRAAEPYAAAWHFQAALRKETPAPMYFTARHWSTPAAQIEGLQRLIRGTRKLVGLPRFPECLTTAVSQLGLPEDWHQLALEFPDKVNAHIYYFGSAPALERYHIQRIDSRTHTTFGRYLRRHWPGASDHAIRDLVAIYGAGKVVIVNTMEEMLKAVQRGPYSCMQWDSGNDATYQTSDDDNDEIDTDIHPYEVYDPALGWAMAILQKDSKIAGRALIHQPTKTFVRSYGKDSDGYAVSEPTIDAWLKAQGYAYPTEWPEGVRIRAIKSDWRSGYVGPYLDPGPQRQSDNAKRCALVEEDGKLFFERNNTGEYVFDNTDGTLTHDPVELKACAGCGAMRNRRTFIEALAAENTREVCGECFAAGSWRFVETGPDTCGYVPEDEVVEDSQQRVFARRSIESGDVVQVLPSSPVWCEWLSRVTRYGGQGGGYVRDVELSTGQHSPYRLVDGLAYSAADCFLDPLRQVYKLYSQGVEYLSGQWVSQESLSEFLKGFDRPAVERFSPAIREMCLKIWDEREAVLSRVETPKSVSGVGGLKLASLKEASSPPTTWHGVESVR